MVSFFAWGDQPDLDVAADSSNIVDVELTFQDGTSNILKMSEAELLSFEVDTPEDLVACTISLSDGSCSCSGPTCAAARRCFYGPDGCVDAPNPDSQRGE